LRDDEEHEPETASGRITLDDMQVSSTDATGMHFDEDLICPRLGNGYIGQSQGMRLDRSGSVEEHGSHDESVCSTCKDDKGQ